MPDAEIILEMKDIVKQYPMGDEVSTVLKGISLDIEESVV